VSGSRLRHAAVAVAAAAALLATGSVTAGCATGHDAVVQGGSFEFVSPGGKTKLYYDPADKRGTIGAVRGRSLMEPDKQIGVDDFPGKVVVLNVWGSWCGPCRTEAADLERVHLATADQRVAFLGINVRETAGDSAAQDFVHSQGITFGSIYDPPGRNLLAISADYPTTVVPTTVVLDRKHRVAAVYLTTVSETELQNKVLQLAKEPA
jgi:thiol-disulfide isomerase/thioredoxin